MLAATLAVLSALLPPSHPESDLRGTSIVVVEGIRGGASGPIWQRTVTFGYDWNRCEFRAVELQLKGPEPGCQRVFRALDLEGERFRKIVERVLELGLPSLPIEPTAVCEDLYRRDTSIRFSHAGRIWKNRTPGGCLAFPSSVPVTPQQVSTFDAVLALLNGALAEGGLQPASALDSLPPHDRTEAEIRKLALAVDVLREMGEAGNVNANEAQVGGPGLLSLGVRVPCLETQPCSSDYGNPVVPIGWWDLRLSPDGDRIQEVHETPVPGERNVRTAHRIAFVAGHPELLGPQRDLILAGWVGYGMSEQMVCAAWGAPVERTVERDGVALRYMRAGADLVRSQVTLRFRENGLQIGW